MKKPRPKPKREREPAEPIAPAKRVVVCLDDVPGLNEHLASVQREITRLREVAMADLPVLLCGLSAEQFKPRHRSTLAAMGNSFVLGGRVDMQAVAQFLLIVAPGSAEEIPEILGDMDQAVASINAYLDDAFMDRRATSGAGGNGINACLTAQLFQECFTSLRWEPERTADTPFAAIFQWLNLNDADAYARSGQSRPPCISRVDAARSKYIQDYEEGII